jgi:multidrug efflux pump subunit AcrA (membrane-fusion protein)
MPTEHEEWQRTNDDIMPDGSLAPVLPQPDTAPLAMAPTVPDFSFDDLDDDLAPTPRTGLTRGRIIAGVAVIAVLGLVGGLIAHATHPASVPLVYTNGTVTQGNLTVTTTASGQIGGGVYDLNFATSGTVTAIDVHVGQTVKTGQVLAQLDTTALQDALNSAENGLQNAQVNLNNAYINQADGDAVAYDTYEQNIARDKGNAQKLKQDLDQYNQTLIQAQQQVASAQQQVQNAQIQLTTAQHNLSDATLKAPVAGQIATINGQVGASSGSGSSSFIVLVNLSALSINAQVNEANIGSLQLGDPVTFTVPAYPSATFYGTVAAITPIGTTTQSVVTFPIAVTIDPASAKQDALYPGMTAQLTITTKQVIAAILVPTTALTYARTAVRSGRITTTATQQALAQAQQLITSATDASVKQGQASYVLEQQQGQVVAVPVVIGISNGTNTVVLTGLQVGDTVLTGDNQQTTTTSTSTSTSGGRGGAGGFGGFGGFIGGNHDGKA